jgi:putative membrane protein
MSDRRPFSTDELALQRTVMAVDRTLMAWTRTALSLISFGFTIFKFLQYAKQEGGQAQKLAESGPRNLGMVMISMGVVFLCLACIQFWRELRRLSPDRRLSAWRLSMAMALALALIGVLALANTALNIGPL